MILRAFFSTLLIAVSCSDWWNLQSDPDRWIILTRSGQRVSQHSKGVVRRFPRTVHKHLLPPLLNSNATAPLKSLMGSVDDGHFNATLSLTSFFKIKEKIDSDYENFSHALQILEECENPKCFEKPLTSLLASTGYNDTKFGDELQEFMFNAQINFGNVQNTSGGKTETLLRSEWSAMAYPLREWLNSRLSRRKEWFDFLSSLREVLSSYSFHSTKQYSKPPSLKNITELVLSLPASNTSIVTPSIIEIFEQAGDTDNPVVTKKETQFLWEIVEEAFEKPTFSKCTNTADGETGTSMTITGTFIKASDFTHPNGSFKNCTNIKVAPNVLRVFASRVVFLDRNISPAKGDQHSELGIVSPIVEVVAPPVSVSPIVEVVAPPVSDTGNTENNRTPPIASDSFEDLLEILANLKKALEAAVGGLLTIDLNGRDASVLLNMRKAQKEPFYWYSYPSIPSYIEKECAEFDPMDEKNGEKGKDGRTGEDGQNGGNFIVISEEIVNVEKLRVSVKGGNGGNGENGEAGKNAKKGAPFPVSRWEASHIYIDVYNGGTCNVTGRAKWQNYNDNCWGYGEDCKERCISYGCPGGIGGDGGTGGSPGDGGAEGNIQLISLQSSFVDGILLQGKGADGVGGRGGAPGRGGDRGDGVDAEVWYYWNDEKPSTLERIEMNSPYGTWGADGVKKEGERRVPLYTLTPPGLLLDYKKFAIPKTTPTFPSSRTFICHIETKREVSGGRSEFTEELLLLLEETWNNKSVPHALLPYYDSLIFRIDTFFKDNNNNTHKNALSPFYAAAADQAKNLRREVLGIPAEPANITEFVWNIRQVLSSFAFHAHKRSTSLHRPNDIVSLRDALPPIFRGIVSPSIVDLFKQNGGPANEARLLWEMVADAFETPQISDCSTNKNVTAMRVTGTFITASDFTHPNGSFVECTNESGVSPNVLSVFATRIVFLDTNISPPNATGHTELGIVSPVLQIVVPEGRNKAITIDLSGHAPRFVRQIRKLPTIPDYVAQKVPSHIEKECDKFDPMSNKTGKIGTPGNPGMDGGSGGNFISISEILINWESLMITVKGGRGGNGGDGTDGGDGNLGANFTRASWKDPETYLLDEGGSCCKPVSERSTWESYNDLCYGVTTCYSHGCPGGMGGDGGRGGAPGRGGRGGNIQMLPQKCQSLSSLQLVDGDGEDGEVGKGGLPGRGGYRGNGTWGYVERASIWNSYSWWKESNTKLRMLLRSSSGNDGVDGAHKPPALQESTKFTLSPTSLLLEYKRFAVPIPSATLPAFFHLMDNNEELTKGYKSLDFAQELLHLEESHLEMRKNRRHSHSNNSREDLTLSLLPHYESFIFRLDSFLRKNDTKLDVPRKKLLSLVYSLALNQARSLRQVFGTPVIVNVKEYLNLFKNRLKRYATVASIVLVNEEKTKYSSTLTEKIEQGRKFIAETVEPTIESAQKDINLIRIDLERKVSEMIAESYKSQLEYKAAVETMKTIMLIRKFTQGLQLVGAVSSFFGPKGALVGKAVGLTATIIESVGMPDTPKVAPLKGTPIAVKNLARDLRTKTDAVRPQRLEEVRLLINRSKLVLEGSRDFLEDTALSSLIRDVEINVSNLIEKGTSSEIKRFRELETAVEQSESKLRQFLQKIKLEWTALIETNNAVQNSSQSPQMRRRRSSLLAENGDNNGDTLQGQSATGGDLSPPESVPLEGPPVGEPVVGPPVFIGPEVGPPVMIGPEVGPPVMIGPEMGPPVLPDPPIEPSQDTNQPDQGPGNEPSPSDERSKEEAKKSRQELVQSLTNGIDNVDKAISSIVGANQRDNAELERYQQLAAEASEQVKDLQDYEQSMRDVLVPAMDTIISEMESAAAKLQKNENTQVSVRVQQWKVGSVLRKFSSLLQKMTEGLPTEYSRRFSLEVETLQDGMNLMIDLYSFIEKYQEQISFADYVANINSPSASRSALDGPEGVIYNKIERAMKASILLRDWDAVTQTVKQWAFPFAAEEFPELFKTDEVHDFISNTTTEIYNTLLPEIENRLESLINHVKQGESTINTKIDARWITSEFYSSNNATDSFFVWKYEEHTEAVKKLLSGQKVTLSATPDYAYSRGKAAVKFTIAEIAPKASSENATVQKELQQILNKLSVEMTHSGIAKYLYEDNSYEMIGEMLPMEYRFQKNTNGLRDGTNAVYKKVQQGDLILSPYTQWTVQLKEAIQRREPFNFTNLEKLAPFVDVELKGYGKFVWVVPAASLDNVNTTTPPSQLSS